MFNKKIFIFIFIALVAITCDNNGNVAGPDLDGLQVSGFDASIAIVEVHSHEEEESEGEHEDADGFILENGSGEIYRQFQGTITTPFEGNHILSEVGVTEELTVYLLNASGEEIIHEDEEHEMEIEITGVGVGSTTFSMELWHDGHVDWSSTSLIEIIVIE